MDIIDILMDQAFFCFFLKAFFQCFKVSLLPRFLNL